jgi:hypothetical protein
MEFIMENKELVLLTLFCASEWLALNPKIKSNGLFDLARNQIKKWMGK